MAAVVSPIGNTHSPIRRCTDGALLFCNRSTYKIRNSSRATQRTSGSRLAIAAGYQFRRLNFSSSVAHGYFDPNTYQSHLGVTGIRLRFNKTFYGEYLARVGGESISSGPYRTAWEANLQNHATLGNWDIGVNYTYFHIAQSTGAFRAHVPRVTVTYRF